MGTVEEFPGYDLLEITPADLLEAVITVDVICDDLACNRTVLAVFLEVTPKTISAWTENGSVPAPVRRWYESEKRLRDLTNECIKLMARATGTVP